MFCPFQIRSNVAVIDQVKETLFTFLKHQKFFFGLVSDRNIAMNLPDQTNFRRTLDYVHFPDMSSNVLSLPIVINVEVPFQGEGNMHGPV